MTITSSHFEAIGKVAYEWSRLEFHIQLLIGRMVNLPPSQSLVITNAANIRSWADMLSRLTDEVNCDQSTLDRYKKLKTEICENLLPARNRVIHGIWSISYEELYGDKVQPPPNIQATVKTLLKAGKQMKKEYQMTARDILEISEKIRAALLELLAVGSLLKGA